MNKSFFNTEIILKVLYGILIIIDIVHADDLLSYSIEEAEYLSSRYERIENKSNSKSNSFFKPLYKLDLLLDVEYARPNERYPEKGKDIWKDATEGLYVSVGTERGFIGAAMSSKVTGLILVDQSSRVNLFNHLNILLLKIAVDKNDYVYLRNRADHDYIIKRAAVYGVSDSEMNFLSNQSVFKFIKFIVRNTFFLRPVSMWALNSSIANKVHYQKDSVLFDRIHKMAKENKIKVFPVDFNDDSKVEALANFIESSRGNLSVLDISNAWWGEHQDPKSGRLIWGYVAKAKLERLLLRMADFSSEKSLLLVTNLDTRFEPIKMVWNYFGFHLSEVKALIKQGRSAELFTSYNKLGDFRTGKVNSLTSLLGDKFTIANECLSVYN